LNKFIIYSGGKDGYCLYDSHPEFPEEYRDLIEDLYVNKKIVDLSGTLGGERCYRFAPLGDGYVFSVIYKDCYSNQDKRGFYATVNWVFTSQEADSIYYSDFRNSFNQYIKDSDRILTERGYTIPEMKDNVVTKAMLINDDIQKAVFSSMYSACRVASMQDNMLMHQVLMGRNEQQGLFGDLFVMYDIFPHILRKRLSFYIGFSSVSETNGVALAITRNEALQYIVSSGNYDGSMAISRAILLNDRLTDTSFFPETVEGYISLPKEQRLRISQIFSYSTNEFGYLEYIKAVIQQGNMIYDRRLNDLLGEDAYADFAFTEEEKAKIWLASNSQLINSEIDIRGLNDPVETAENTDDLKKNAVIKGKHKKKKKKDNRTKQSQNVTKEADKSKTLQNNKFDKGSSRYRTKTENEAETRQPETAQKSEGGSPKLKNGYERKKVDISFEINVVRRVLPVFFVFVFFSVLFLLFSGIVYAIGVYLIAALPKPWSLLAYAVQIGATVFISMLGGYLIFSYIGKLIRHRQRLVKKPKE